MGAQGVPKESRQKIIVILFQDLGWQIVSLVVPFSLMNLTDLNMNTVELVLYMQLIRHLVNIREAASNPVTNQKVLTIYYLHYSQLWQIKGFSFISV